MEDVPDDKASSSPPKQVRSPNTSSDLLSLDSPLASHLPKSLLVDKKKKSKPSLDSSPNGPLPASNGSFPLPRTSLVEKSGVLGRLKAFLPEMEKANKDLNERIARGEDVVVEIGKDEDGEEKEESKEDSPGLADSNRKIIEMTLGLFERESDVSSDDDEDDDDENDDADHEKQKDSELIVEMH